MSAFREAEVTINEVDLGVGTVMTLRVAVTHFYLQMQDSHALGEDDTGEGIRKGYVAQCRVLLTLLQEPQS